MLAINLRVADTLSMNVPDNAHDHELLRHIAAGDRAAFDELYARYGQRLYAYAYRRMDNASEARDVLQESLLAVWLGAKSYRGEGRAIAWLLKIVHNQSLRAMRGQKHAQLTGLESLPDPAPSPDAHGQGSEQHHALAAALAQLSTEHRSALELVFFHGLSLQEAADVCSCPLGTLKSRLTYAKKALQGELARAGLTAEDLL